MEEAELKLRWGYTFLLTSPKLSETEKFDLLKQATEMYLLGEERRSVKSDNYDGVLFTERAFQLVGTFSGVRFDAELQTDDGKINVRFLVSEQTEGRGVAYSLN